MSDHPFHHTLEVARRRLPGGDAQRYAVLLRRGTLEVGLYAPEGRDDQQPHDQDEVYVVQSGQGIFRLGDERIPFGPGDVLMVPAGVDHRFEEFSADFETWVLFYGPQGGEEAGGEDGDASADGLADRATS